MVVLGMTLLVGGRPLWATLTLAQTPPIGPSRLTLTQAGGGAAMLSMAAYLLTQTRDVTGSGFWDLPLLALHSPDLRVIPGVWLPALCWFCLAGLGAWWLLAGARATRIPRDLTGFVWAVNEIAIVSSLLLWNVTVPDAWGRAALFGFGVKGVYVCYLAGAAVRLTLALGSFAFPPAEPPHGPAHRVNSTARRF